MSASKSLTLLSDARKALISAKTLTDLANIRDVAKAAEAYATAAHLGTDSINEAIEVRLRAERRAGEMLAKMPLPNAGERRAIECRQEPIPATLSDIGVTKKESANWQAIASVDAQRFEDYLARERRNGGRLSGAALLRKLYSDVLSETAQVPAYLRWEVWERDDFRCRVCGVRRFLTIDHVIPRSSGGSMEADNLQTLCEQCNSRKGDR